MRTQRRNKRVIYLCQKYITADGLVLYHEPIEIKENYNSTKIIAENIIPMGMEYPNKLRIKADNKICVNGEWMRRSELYHPGDRVYVFVEPPEKHDDRCKTADYEVDTDIEPQETINQITITLVKLSGKNKY